MSVMAVMGRVMIVIQICERGNGPIPASLLFRVGFRLPSSISIQNLIFRKHFDSRIPMYNTVNLYIKM